MSSKVYIVQEPTKWDAASGTRVAVQDLTPASVFGKLEVLLPSGQLPILTDPLIGTLRHKLRDFCDDDYLLAAGDPLAIACAAAIAAEINNGRFKLLRWDRRAKQYIEFSVNVRR